MFRKDMHVVNTRCWKLRLETFVVPQERSYCLTSSNYVNGQDIFAVSLSDI